MTDPRNPDNNYPAGGTDYGRFVAPAGTRGIQKRALNTSDWDFFGIVVMISYMPPDISVFCPIGIRFS
jgi:hypothetical protein